MVIDVANLIETTVLTWNGGVAVGEITPITPDASLRRYFRVTVTGWTAPTIVVMIFDSLSVPEATGGPQVDSFDAYVILEEFLAKHNIPVPGLLYQQKKPPILILEDLGNTMLSDILVGKVTGKRSIEDYYRSAIDALIEIGDIKPESALFAFNRGFSRSVYIREMNETSDYILRPSGATESEIECVAKYFDFLSDELERLPKVLVHRDFHSWNLMVDTHDRVRVIDFQDALLGPRSYDLVGLCNDRDTDAALGEERYRDLIRYFAERWRGEGDFYFEYDRVLLQRDLKVAGRFGKLVKERGLMSYGTWIPGTLRRIGRTLRRIGESGGAREYADLFRVLSHYCPDVRAGHDSPINFR